MIQWMKIENKKLHTQIDSNGTNERKPGPRWGHSCCSVDKYLYLIGGFDGMHSLTSFFPV